MSLDGKNLYDAQFKETDPGPAVKKCVRQKPATVLLVVTTVSGDRKKAGAD